MSELAFLSICIEGQLRKRAFVRRNLCSLVRFIIHYHCTFSFSMNHCLSWSLLLMVQVND